MTLGRFLVSRAEVTSKWFLMDHEPTGFLAEPTEVKGGGNLGCLRSHLESNVWTHQGLLSTCAVCAVHILGLSSHCSRVSCPSLVHSGNSSLRLQKLLLQGVVCSWGWWGGGGGGGSGEVPQPSYGHPDARPILQSLCSHGKNSPD